MFVFLVFIRMTSAEADGTMVVFPTPEGKLYSIALQGDSAFWCGGYSIWKYDFASETWTEFNKNNELFDTIVTDICVASDGTVWFSTQEEVLRFDGINWTKLTYEDGLPYYQEEGDDLRSSVWSVAEAPDGSMWFAGDGGISVFDGSTWKRFTIDDGLPEPFVGPLSFGHDGSVWCGSSYGGAGRYLNGTWETFIIRDGDYIFNNLRGIKCAPDGTMWFGSSNGVCSYKDGIWNTYTTKDGLSHNQTMGFAFDDNDTVWIATHNGISLFDGEQWSIMTTDDGLTSNNVFVILEGPGNEKWIRTGPAININNPDVAPLIINGPDDSAYLKKGIEAGFSWDTWPGAETYEIEFADNGIFEDSERYTITGTSFTKIMNDELGYDTPGYWRIRAIGEDQQSYWTSPRSFFTVIPGPELLTPVEIQFVRAGDEYTFTWAKVPNATVYEIQFSGSLTFDNVEQFSSSVTSFDHTVNDIYRRENPAYWRVRAVIDGNTGDWSEPRSFFTKEAWVHYTTANGLVHNEVNAIAADPNGGAWIGTSGGISFYDGTTWRNYTEEDGLVHNHVTALIVDADGELWVGTIGGVSNYNGSEWRNYTVYNGLVDGTVYGLKVAPDNRVWITTTRTVSSFDGEIWTHYIFDSQFTGLEKLFHNKREISISPDGDVWVVSPQHGVMMYDGSQWYTCDTQNIAPGTHITGLDIAPDGMVWLSFWEAYNPSNGGIAWYDGDQWNVESSNFVINGFTLAPDCSVWFSGHDHRGIWRYNDNSWTLEDEKKVGWSDAMVFDADGLLYASAGVFTSPMEYWPYKKGLWIYDGYKNTPNTEPPGENIWGNFTETITPEIKTGNETVAKGITKVSPEGKWTTYDIGSVSDIAHDGEFIWCSTNGGVVRFDTRDNSFMSIGGPDGKIAITNDGSVWICRGKVYRWDSRAWSRDLTRSDDYEGGPWSGLAYGSYLEDFSAGYDIIVYMLKRNSLWKYENSWWYRVISLDDGEISSVDTNGTVWQAVYENDRCIGIIEYGGDSKTMHELPFSAFEYIQFIEVSPDYIIWVDVHEGGAFSYDGVSWTEYSSEEKTLAYYNVMAHNGVFWKGDSNGLHRLELSSSDVDEDYESPKEFELLQNHPNPFNPSTAIEFTLSESGFTTLTVYNISGQQICKLAAEYITAGTHNLTWDGRDNSGKAVSSGVYIIRLQAGKHVASRSMLHMK